MSTKSGEKDKEGGTSMASVHSANQWESADFGDESQKAKFLRLMGGMKKQHTGRFVIGETNKDTHSRTDDETIKMEKTLEHQYEVGLEKKLTGQNRRHVGLGFSEPEEKKDKLEGTHTRFDDEEDEASKDSEMFCGQLEDGRGESGESEKERRDKRRRERKDEHERQGSRERDPERETSRREERDDDKKQRDDDGRCDSRTASSKSGDSSQNGAKKHKHSEEGGEQKRKKQKKQEDDSGSD